MKSRPKLHGDPDHLIPSWARETGEDLQPGQQANCDVCGLVGAGCFGFGSFRTTRGVWACTKDACRAEAQARASGQRNLIAAE